MSLSPDDIVGYRFERSLRGYAVSAVDDLLDRLADQVERTQAELQGLRERVSAAEAQVAAAREAESTLQRTLVVAQQAAERTLAESEEAAATALRTAEVEAERVRSDATVQAEATLAEAQDAARREADAARARVEEARRRHLDVLEDVARHRDALRADVELLDELVTGAEPDAPAPVGQLAVGELAVRSPHASVAEPAVPTPTDQESAVRTADTLQVRVHDDATDGSAPLGSTRDGS